MLLDTFFISQSINNNGANIKMADKINVTIWNEFRHEKNMPAVKKL